MATLNGKASRLFLALVAVVGLGAASTASALPPSPPNDTPATAEVIGAVPALINGTSVLADNSINSTGGQIPAIDTFMDGPDVFYSFTPGISDTHRFQLLPWQYAPLRSSDRRFTIYAYRQSDGVYVGGVRAAGDARPVHLDVALTAGTTYIFGVDHDDIAHDNFEFTLLVDRLVLTNPDNCGSAITLAGALPIVVLNNIDGSVNDFTFSQDGGRCAVSGTTPTTAAGNDHVYYFSPPATGDYAIELVGNTFDAVLYVDDSCGPFFPDGCMGASNHGTGGTTGARHEMVVVSLTAGGNYWIFVDNGSTTSLTGNYALIIDDAFTYEISEMEPNDSAGAASPVGTPLNGGQLVGPVDEDWFAIPGSIGDRVYCWVNNGGSLNSTIDTDLGFYAADGSTLIEFDDDDADGADAPIEDLRFIYSTSAPVIAGAKLTSDAPHYLRVTDTTATGTVHRYRLHVGVEPATRIPLAESEPNETPATANFTAKHFYSGVVDVVTDRDVFAFDAVVGDRVFVAFDGDPERDSAGNQPANTDPLAFHGKLVLYDPAGNILISDISDANSAQTGGGDYPAQGGFFVARTTGRHYVEVGPQSSASQVGPTETYELAIFLNDQPPPLLEENNPTVTLTPDYVNDVIHGTATDNLPDDSGVCSIELLNNTNLQLTNVGAMPAPVVTFDIELVSLSLSGSALVVVTDCAGNNVTAQAIIDVDAPVCTGFNFANRNLGSLHGPIHAPDNQPSGPGINGTIDVVESGIITDVNVTITIETISPPDMDVWLESPLGTRVELITDRGSSSVFDITDATFDDSAAEIMPTSSGAAPYTGTWKPEDPLGLAQLIGQNAQGTWKLNVVDDSSSASGGARLVRWSLDINAGFGAPEAFDGTATDNVGIASVVLNGAVNAQLSLLSFTPGDTAAQYMVSLIDPTLGGSGTVLVTDLQENTCQSVISLSGLVDSTAPTNTGTVTTDLTFKKEVLASVPTDDPAGVVSSVTVAESLLVGKLEADITIDTKEVGRITSTLSHAGEFAALVNRVGMDERFGVGLTKDNMDITLDDDAPVADDAHEEPALGSTEFLGLHQPDGRGDFLLNGITSDPRDNMMFNLAGAVSAGQWDLYVADVRPGFASTNQTAFRRWAMTIKNPCGPERYVGRAIDREPGTGICSLALGGGSSNLVLVASFAAGDEVVDYRVELADPTQPGSGTVEIADCAANMTVVAVALGAAESDGSLPILAGSVNPSTFQFEGTATDSQPGDSGIAEVALAPWSDNLQIVSVTPDPPGGAASVSFVVGLVNPAANGRGYARVTDVCGLRSFILVDIDAAAPVCTGAVGTTKRYWSTDTPLALPDNNTAGASSSIVVSDTNVISDLNLTFTILHPFDDDIDLSLTSPVALPLFTDIGSTGNDFIDTTLDDDAAAPIPDSSSEAPFTNSYQPEGGPIFFVLEGSPANGTYTLKAVDDAVNYTGTLEKWSLLIESLTFPQRYDGRTQDGGAHDSGVCSIALLPGALHLTLVVEPFTPGDKIVRYSVEIAPPFNYGRGYVRVTDCAGNTCDTFVELGEVCGDFDNDGFVDSDDYFIFLDAFGTCVGHPKYKPECDFVQNGCIDFADFTEWLICYYEANNEPWTGPPPPRPKRPTQGPTGDFGSPVMRSR